MLTYAFAAALVDFVWQGTLVALPVAVGLRALRRRSPQARYALGATAMIALVALPVVTTVLRYATGEREMVPVSVVAESSRIARFENREVAFTVNARPDYLPTLASVEPWILPVWSVGVLLLSLRLAMGGLQVRALRRSGRRADADLCERVSRLATRMGIHRPIDLMTSTRIDCPSVIGWLRPLVLMPPAGAMGLTIEQLETVLAHELAHIRRHDYLVNIVQMIAETLLFYHPAVWWLSKHLRIERELCCDVEAVSVCGDAATYARALVTMARVQVASMAMGSTGGSLSDRVRVLLGVRVHEPRRSAALAAVVTTAALVSMALATINGQTEHLRFEVASVKPARGDATGYRGIAFLPGGVVRGSQVPLSFLITRAYDLSWKQLVSDSDLLNERFEIEARADVRALPPEGSTIEQTIRRQSPPLKKMLQTLLSERFNLVFHVEKRDSLVYALVVGPKGHRLTPMFRDCGPRTVDEAASNGSPCGFQGGGPARGFRLYGAELPTLAGALTLFTDRFVVDRTGIQGRFDIELPPWSTGGPPRSAAADLVQEPQPDPNAPSLFTVTQEQLGLRLEPTRAPIDMYVIDHVERPTPN
jgi:uncharacterized protein (TIGR03435 family)